MRIAYSTYAMQTLDVFDALPRVRAIGYDAVEIAVAEGWATAPGRLDAAARRRLGALLRELGFPPPALFGPVPTCVRGDARAAVRARFSEICALARDLNFGDGPAVVTSTLGGPLSPDWEGEKQRIAEDLLDLAELAGETGAILAVEPHVGGVFDAPEKAAWLMRRTGHPCLKLNFDYSHFHVQGMDLKRCADLCLPHAAHLHIKDGRMENGRVVFLLPGQGTLDLVAYCRTLRGAGCELPVVAEVSAQIWNASGYDPWAAAESCYRALDRARRADLFP